MPHAAYAASRRQQQQGAMHFRNPCAARKLQFVYVQTMCICMYVFVCMYVL